MSVMADNQHNHWWQDIVLALAPILDTLKQSLKNLTQNEVEAKLSDIHHAYSIAHRVTMPINIQAQLIATICNLQTSYCARSVGQKRISAKHYRIAQVEWILFQEMLAKEGINYQVLQ